MAEPVGQIAVRLTADTGDFRRKLNKAQKTVARMGAQMRNAANVAGKYAAALAAAGIAIGTKLVSNSLKAIDAQAKLARQLGTTQTSIAGLTRAANLSGVAQNELERNISAFNKRLGEAIDGTGEAKTALDKLGLSARELSQMPLDKQMAVIGDEVNKLGTSAEKAAVASDLFSRAGLNMVNLFEGGGDAIRQATEEAQAFGTAISDVDAAKVEAANDAMTAISDTFRGFINRVTIKLAPVLEAIAKKFQQASIESKGFQDQATTVVKVVTKGLGFIVDTIQGIRIAFQAGKLAAAAFNAALFTGLQGVGKAVGFVHDSIVSVLNLMARAASRIPGIQIPEFARFEGSGTEQFLDDLAASARENVGIVKEELKTMAQEAVTSRDLEKWVETVEQAATEAATKVNAARRNVVTPSVDEDSDEDKKRRERLLARFETRRTLELEHLTALKDLRRAFEEGEIESESEFNERRLQLQRQFFQRWQGLQDSGYQGLANLTAQHFSAEAAEIAGATSNIVSTLAQGSKKAFEIQKQWALADALISTYQGIAAGVRLGWPMGIPAVAWAAANGFAQVSKIRSQSFSGGGSTGGAGGGGSAGSAGSAQPRPPTQDVDRVITLQGIGANDMLSGRQLRDLADRLNEMQEDGKAILKVA